MLGKIALSRPSITRFHFEVISKMKQGSFSYMHSPWKKESYSKVKAFSLVPTNEVYDN